MRGLTFTGMALLVSISGPAFAQDSIDAKGIPPSVMTAYNTLPSQMRAKSVECCLNHGQIVYRVNWSTGYVAGSDYFSQDGQELGQDTSDDTGQSSSTYEARALSDCVQLLKK